MINFLPKQRHWPSPGGEKSELIRQCVKALIQRQTARRLAALLEVRRVVCHPYVVTEVACGTPPNRRAIIAMLAELESTPLVTSDEILELIERRSLYGRGCGFVDMGLLASALLSD